MTVAELIAELQTYPPDADLVIRNLASEDPFAADPIIVLKPVCTQSHTIANTGEPVKVTVRIWAK